MIALGFYMDCATCMDVVMCFTFTDLLNDWIFHAFSSPVQQSSPLNSDGQSDIFVTIEFHVGTKYNGFQHSVMYKLY